MPAYDPERNKNTYTMKFNEYKGLDLAQIAADVLGEWDARDTFHKSITTREGHPAFVFYEGPPSANGMPGIHHVMARTIKDVFCRYKTQQGYLVHRKAGWDTHGLPVELGVERSSASPRKTSAGRFRSRSTTAPAARPSWNSRGRGKT